MENEYVKFTDKQKEKIISLGLKLDFSNLSDDDLVLIEDTVGTRVDFIATDFGDYTEEERVLYSILDYLSEI